MPPAPARLWVVAPSAKGQWLLRIDNEGDEPLRIAADVRLLRLEIWPQAKGKWARRPTTCDGPKSFGLQNSFPAERELLLGPGQSWVEPFDPRLICFGKQAKLLEGGALVRAHFGWPEPSRWQRSKKRGLVAVDATQVPRRYEARSELVGPTMLLSYMSPEPWAQTIDQVPFPPPPGKRKGRHSHGSSAAAGSDGAPSQPGETAPDGADGASAAAGQPGGGETDASSPPTSAKLKDELGSRLTLTADRFADALYPRNVVVGVHVHNAGERSGRVALRSRQLSFRVQGPDGVVECPRRTLSHVVPPDLFGRLGEGKQVEINVLLAELCRRDAFRRPGLYVAMPKIDATEVDREKRVDAITGNVSTRDPGVPGAEEDWDDDATLIRIRRGIESLHVEKPAVLSTSTLSSQSLGEVVEAARTAVKPRPELVKPKRTSKAKGNGAAPTKPESASPDGAAGSKSP